MIELNRTKFYCYFILCFLMSNVLLSCSEDDIERQTVLFYANNFSLNVYENPEVGEHIGKIVAFSETGSLSFKIRDEFPIDAIHVDPITGVLTVKDPTKYDWEAYRSVMVKVDVSNGVESQMILVSIQILDRLEQDNYLLKRMVERVFDDQGNENLLIETQYTLGKMTSRYHIQRQMKDEFFSYNDQGLMSKQVVYENGLIYETISITYDDTFRITSIDHDYNDITRNWREAYTYPNETEINAVQINDHGHRFERRFVLVDGMVTEEWVDDYSPLFKATYEDKSIQYMFDQVSDIYYTYEEIGTNPHRYYEKMFASIPSNIVLYHENLSNASDFFTDRLIKEKVYQNDLPFFIRFEYELNEVDLPVNSKTILEEAGEIRVLRETSYEFEKRTKEGGLIPDASISD